jgi:hypothetical protein
LKNSEDSEAHLRGRLSIYDKQPTYTGEKRGRKPESGKKEEVSSSRPPQPSYGAKGIPTVYGMKPQRTTTEEERTLD